MSLVQGGGELKIVTLLGVTIFLPDRNDGTLSPFGRVIAVFHMEHNRARNHRRAEAPLALSMSA